MTSAASARSPRWTLRPALAGLAVLLVPAVAVACIYETSGGTPTLASAGVPPAQVQVITLPGLTRQAYQWYPNGREVQAYWVDPATPDQNGWLANYDFAAMETVTRGSASPCAPVIDPDNPGLIYPEDNGAATPATTCSPDGPGLWMLTSSDGTGVGFVRHAYGMTITLTGFSAHQRELKQAILAACPASSADMRGPVDVYSTPM